MRKSTDIRVVRTQNALLEALEELIKTKKLSCISITELCTQAGINRNTFYYHYNNIYELLDENKQIMISELNEILVPNRGISNRETLINLCKCIKRHPKFLSILISPNCDLDYFNDIFTLASDRTGEIIEKKKEIKSPRDFMICYYCNAGCNAVIQYWIRNGMQESTEEIAEIIADASKRGPIALLLETDL